MAILFWLGSFLIPERYTSSAVIRLDVEPFPTIDVVAFVWQDVVSRNSIKSIVEQFKLYPAERERLPLEDVIETLKDRDLTLDIQPDHSVRIAFTYPDPIAAQAVTSAFMARMIASAAERADATPGWGLLDLLGAPGPAESAPAWAFWKPRRYVAHGLLRIRKMDNFVVDQAAVDRRTETFRQKLRHDVKDPHHWQITSRENVIFLKFTTDNPKQAQSTVSRMLTRILDESRMPKCDPSETAPALAVPDRMPYQSLEPLAGVAAPDNVSGAVVALTPDTQPRFLALPPNCNPDPQPLSLLDPASLPEHSDGPVRSILAAFGFFLGLGMWLAFKTE
jgi:hypothetical protein